MSATQISIVRAKADFAALVSRAEAGEEIIVTRNGKPVARLTALTEQPVAYDDLAGLRIDDDLSLPESLVDEFLAR
jgi:prevent-host-death family protein